MKDILTFISFILGLILFYYGFSFFQLSFAKFLNLLKRRVGIFSKQSDYDIKRYIFLHRGSLLDKIYTWVNEQIIALNLKNKGITPVGYLFFWAFVSVFLSIGVSILFLGSLGSIPVVAGALFLVFLVGTRIRVSSRIEKRELDVMSAIDLIIPSIGGGVKNAIAMYQEKFPKDIRPDFQMFLVSIQDRGVPFDEALFELADNLGPIFRDFAQKAAYFEVTAEPGMEVVFADIVVMNQLRRKLREENNRVFEQSRLAVIVLTVMVVGYLFFILATDPFSRYFLITTVGGRFMLLGIGLTTFLEFSYIITLKSRAI